MRSLILPPPTSKDLTVAILFAFLKANFPTEFLVAAMNLDIDNSDKINIFLQEAKIFDIKIIPPSMREVASHIAGILDNENIEWTKYEAKI